MSTPQKKNKNALVELAVNIVFPVLILTKFSKEDHLGPLWGLIIAVAIPFLYGVYDFIQSKKLNYLSLIGVISVFLTGIFGVLALPPQWIIIKETSIPLILGILVLFASFTRFSLVEKLLYSDQIFNKVDINIAIRQKNKQKNFDKTLKNVNYFLSLSFFVSALLNYLLADYLLVSPPGTPAFNEELGKMTALSFPVIAVPSTLIMVAGLLYMYKRIKAITGLSQQEIFIIK